MVDAVYRRKLLLAIVSLENGESDLDDFRDDEFNESEDLAIRAIWDVVKSVFEDKSSGVHWLLCSFQCRESRTLVDRCKSFLATCEPYKWNGHPTLPSEHTTTWGPSLFAVASVPVIIVSLVATYVFDEFGWLVVGVALLVLTTILIAVEYVLQHKTRKHARFSLNVEQLDIWPFSLQQLQ